jgi:DNA-binding NarL/FixJ family response regulator
MTTRQLARNDASRSNILNFVRPVRDAEVCNDRELARQESLLREALAQVRALRRNQRDTMRSANGDVVRALFAARRGAACRVATLTPREREVLQLVLAGRPNKIVAWELSISQRTVENHRAAIMHKTGSKSLPALALLAVSAAWNGVDGPTVQPLICFALTAAETAPSGTSPLAQHLVCRR